MEKKKLHRLSLHISLILLFVYFCRPLSLFAAEDPEALLCMYREYRQRFEAIENISDIAANGFRIVEDQVFPITLQYYGEVSFVPALDQKYNRLALFFSKEDGSIVYKTDQLETNNRNRGEMKQPNKGIPSVSFEDVNGDGLVDIILITSCVNQSGTLAGKTYKVGDVLFQDGEGFYRDWRISDKINRFSMNKSADFIAAYVRDGYSTEFLYTAVTLDELLEDGFQVVSEQSYPREFEKWGKLQVIPGIYSMADHHVFMIYLVNEQGYIVWSFQPMEDYENLYALKGITCKDIDGDRLKDIVVLARYSYGGEEGGTVIQSDYSIYYQRTSGFYAETDLKKHYQCDDEDTLENVVEKARAYWGWKAEK